MKNYAEIREKYIPGFNVPDEFFLPRFESDDYCIFLISCLSIDRFIYLDQRFCELTGYSTERFIKEGMDFWFSLVHPEDMEGMTAKIIDAHKALFSPGYNPQEPPPLLLEYRFKNAMGDWVWIRDTRYLVSFNEEKVIDKVLCRFESIPVEYADSNDMADMLKKEKSCTRMLEMAMVHQHSKTRRSLDETALSSHPDNPSFRSQLTKREKQILQLISEGLSTKMIAEQCFISIHTVETHRRHLLEKLKVKNSMELIKEASKIFWL